MIGDKGGSLIRFSQKTDGITLITPTGQRPEALALCQRYVERQQYDGCIQWIVVDDGWKTSPLTPPRVDWNGHTYLYRIGFIRPTPVYSCGQNTQARNLLAAIPEIEYDKILFFEDDDWYSPNYVAAMSKLLDDHQIVGEIPARYYHMPTCGARVLGNLQHASLAQSGIRSSMLPLLKAVCETHTTEFIDLRLWEYAKQQNISMCLQNGARHVGIKGMPGREGIGIGHHAQAGWYTPDPNQTTLRAWIGDDVQLYQPFISANYAGSRAVAK